MKLQVQKEQTGCEEEHKKILHIFLGNNTFARHFKSWIFLFRAVSGQKREVKSLSFKKIFSGIIVFSKKNLPLQPILLTKFKLYSLCQQCSN